jgi:hypothetical protein
MKTTVFVGLLFASALAAGTAIAQPAPFNEVGVTMGHWHLASQNAEANKKIFLGMGGELIKRGDAESVRFPGVLINLTLGNAAGNGGSRGSVVNHVGFIVNNVQEHVASLRNARGVGRSHSLGPLATAGRPLAPMENTTASASGTHRTGSLGRVAQHGR